MNSTIQPMLSSFGLTASLLASLLASLITSLIALPGLMPPAHAQTDDMFPTRAAAEKRARELNCTGAFAMGSEWMPCTNFDRYTEALKKKSQ